MKKILSLLILFAGLTLAAQDKPLAFSDVIQEPNKTQAEIYGGLRQWVATNYVNGKAVTQLEDASTGTIIVKAEFPFHKGGIYSAYEGYISYMLKLQAKDGRFRVEVSNFSHENLPGRASDCSLGILTTAEKSGKGGINKAGHNKMWKEMKGACEDQFYIISNSLRNWNSFGTEDEEDW